MGNGQHDLFIEAPIWYEELTGRRRLFVEYYCTDTTCFLNAAAAYRKAYSRGGKALSDLSVKSNSSRLLNDPKIKEAIAKLLRARQTEEDHLSTYQVLDLLKMLTFYNPADLFDEKGKLKQLNEMGELALCVSEIKYDRRGNREIKMHDRTKALTIFAEYLKLTRPADNIIINPNVYLADKDVSQLQEEAEYEVVGA